MPTLKDIEDAINSVENYLAQQLPVITQSFQRLADDLSRFGPPAMPELPTINLPAVGPFASIPPPLPPPPPPPLADTYTDQIIIWAGKNKVAAVGIGSAVSLGIVAGGWMYWRSSPYFRARNAKPKNSEKKDVIILLGADTKLGPSLVDELRNRGFVVIASVSSPEVVASVEKKGKGLVKALVLDPHDPSSIAPFLRSLQSSLSLRFPFTPGDPYTSTPAQLPNVVSLISLLSLLPVEEAPDSTPSFPSSTPSLSSSIESLSPSGPPNTLSTLSISKLYLPHLIATHLTPLSVIQSVLSLFRSSKKRGSKQLSLIIALQGGADSAGLAADDASSAMSNAAMAKGCEILRREIKLSPELSGTRVVVIDVGDISVSDESPSHPLCRKPTPVKYFTRAVGRVVGHAKYHDISSCHHGSFYTGAVGAAACGLGLRLRDLWRGDRFSIGAGARTYSLASRLPIRFLDILLLLPRRILSYRDWLRREAIHADRQAREMARERRRQKEQKRAETPPPPSGPPKPQGPPKMIQHHEEIPLSAAIKSKPSSTTSALSDIDSIPSDVDHDLLSLDGHSEPESESGRSDKLSASWVSLREGSGDTDRMNESVTTVGESAEQPEDPSATHVQGA